MKDIDDTKQPLLEHLIELRRRLLWCLATLVVTFFICFSFMGFHKAPTGKGINP